MGARARGLKDEAAKRARFALNGSKRLQSVKVCFGLY